MLSLPENITCGYCDCSEFGNLEISPKRKVTKYEFEFYLEDGKTTTTDNNVYSIKKDYIQIAKPGQIRFSELPFRTAYLKFNVDGDIAEKIESLPEYFCSSHPKKICAVIEEIILLNEEKDALLFYSKLFELLNLVFSDAEIPAARSGKNYGVISKAKKYIELNFEKTISLKDIASSVHLSEVYFHGIFTESVGISPHQYLIDCRIDNAKKLLWNADVPICEVAEKCGFGCQQYLNKVFKKETGMTPSQYRKTLQENYTL